MRLYKMVYSLATIQFCSCKWHVIWRVSRLWKCNRAKYTLRPPTPDRSCISRSVPLLGYWLATIADRLGDDVTWWMKSHVTSNYYRRRHAVGNEATGHDVRSRGRWIRWVIRGRIRIMRILDVVLRRYGRQTGWKQGYY